MRSDRIVKLEEYEPSRYLLPEIALTFRLDLERTIIISELLVKRRDGVPAGAALELDGDELELVSLQLDGRALTASEYAISPAGLTVKNPPPVAAFRLRIETAVNPGANRKLMGLYVSSGLYCTQCEAEGFRRITYFLDRPDVLTVYTVRIEADRAYAPLLLSNGNPVEAGGLPDGRHYAIWRDPFPKPCYLFALVAGDLAELADSFTTISGRTVRLGIHVEHGNLHRAAYAMDALKRSMRWDEEAFGREYDLDVFNLVAVSDFNIGAMENKGLNIFNDKYVLADAETATDVDFANIEAMVAHEYFHNWTGNRITCRDWFQLCLKEGLTVFRDHEFSSDQRSRAVRRVQAVKALKAQQFPEDAGPLAHPARPRRYREINNFYTATVYEKGSEIVGMLRTLLGHARFRAGMDLFFMRHDGEAVTIEDFLQAFVDASGENLTQFALWYHQAGTPNLAVSADYDEARSTFALHIKQTVPRTPSEHRKRAMHIPVALGLVGENGRDVPYGEVSGADFENGVIQLKRRRHSIVFTDVRERPALSLNRGFSAPVTIDFEQTEPERLFLARRDPDLFNRWQAIATLATDTAIEATRSERWGNPRPGLEAIASLLGDVAGEPSLEPAFRALALTLPGEADIAREIGSNINPAAIRAAREFMTAAIGNANRAAFQDVYASLSDRGPFRTDGESAGRRALRNVLLDYLSVADASPQAAAAHYHDATNMTDRLAALTILVHRFAASSEAGEALAGFKQRYRDNPLVLDKWLHVQATAPGEKAVETVKRLKRDPHFAIDNPNRVRSLIFAFASANPVGFHRADGSGYALLADNILEIDPINPVLASRLATCFGSWRSLDTVLSDRARCSLAHLARHQGLSRNLADIVSRTLS